MKMGHKPNFKAGVGRKYLVLAVFLNLQEVTHLLSSTFITVKIQDDAGDIVPSRNVVFQALAFQGVQHPLGVGFPSGHYLHRIFAFRSAEMLEVQFFGLILAGLCGEALPTGCGLTRPSFAPPSPQSFTAPFSWKTFPLCWEAWIQRIITGCPGRWMGKTGWFISL